MFTSQEIVDVTPGLLFPSESDETPRKKLEVDLTDQNLGISRLIPTSNTDNPIIPPRNRVEDAKGVDLSGGPSDAVVGKLEMNGLLELLGHPDDYNYERSTRVAPLLSLAIDFRRTPFAFKTVVRSHHCGQGNSLLALGVRCLGRSGVGVGAAANMPSLRPAVRKFERMEDFALARPRT